MDQILLAKAWLAAQHESGIPKPMPFTLLPLHQQRLMNNLAEYILRNQTPETFGA